MAAAIARVQTPEDVRKKLAAHLRVRHDVFVVGQNVPLEEEIDEYDGFGDLTRVPDCTFHVNCLIGGVVVGAGRLILKADKVGKIGRIAVQGHSRGSGAGRVIMLKLHEIAAEHGCHSCQLGAQLTAVNFYAKLGYREMPGGVFLDAGIEHINMELRLTQV